MLISAADLRELVSLFTDPTMAGLDDQTVFGVDFRAESDSDSAEHQESDARCKTWLARLPCPSVALVSGPLTLQDGFDVVLECRDAYDRLSARIAAHPIAAMTLVQVLRLVEAIDIHSGLIVESLAFAALQQGPEFQHWVRSSGRTPDAQVPIDQGSPVLLARTGDTLAITLDRPASRNEISAEMRDALFEAFSLAAMDTGIAKVEVAGNGDSFSVGGALGEFGMVGSGAEGHRIRSLRLPARLLADHAHKYVFRLHGACVGAGIELAAFAGHVSASRKSFFQLPELQMGLIPGMGGCVSVSRRIGRRRTAWMVLSGRRISARTALEWGLIDTIED